MASRALLIQWVSQADAVPLDHGPRSFHALADRWLEAACHAPADARHGGGWPDLAVKFFDFLEANAESLWQVPDGVVAAPRSATAEGNTLGDELLHEDADEADDRFQSAYDDMVYVDSTADGVDGDMLESTGPADEAEWESQTREVRHRLRFLGTAASLCARQPRRFPGAPREPRRRPSPSGCAYPTRRSSAG